jgi:hypothetical protein
VFFLQESKLSGNPVTRDLRVVVPSVLRYRCLVGTWKEWIQAVVVGELWAFFMYYFSSKWNAFSFFRSDNLSLTHPEHGSGEPSADGAAKELRPSAVVRFVRGRRPWHYTFLILLGLVFGMLETFPLVRLRHGGLLLMFLGICTCLVVLGFLSHRLGEKVVAGPPRPSLWERAFTLCAVAFLGLVFAFDWSLLHGWLLVVTIAVVAGAALAGFMDWRLKRRNLSSSY